MFSPWEAISKRHLDTAMCDNRVERKRKWWVKEEAKAIKIVAFQAYGRSLEMVTLFKYLGRVIISSDNNWSALVVNI